MNIETLIEEIKTGNNNSIDVSKNIHADISEIKKQMESTAALMDTPKNASNVLGKVFVDGRSFITVNKRLDEISGFVQAILFGVSQIYDLSKESAESRSDKVFNKEDKEDKPEKSKDSSTPDLSSLGLLSLAGALSGLLVGFYERIAAPFAKVGNIIKENFSKVTEGIKNFFGRIGKFFENIKVPAFISKAGAFISGFIDDTVRVVRTMMGFVKGLGSGFGKLFGTFEPFFSIFRSIGRIFMPLFLVFETVTGAMKEFDKLGEDASGFDKFGAILKGGLKGIISGLFTGLLDLLKNGVSWVAEFFGFTGFAEYLDSFSFVEMGNQLIDGIISLATQGIGHIKDFFVEYGGKIGESFADFGEKLAKFITLPYNLIMQGIGKLAGMLGFENVSKALEGYNLIDEVVKVFDSMINGIKEYFKGLSIAQAVKRLLFGSDEEPRPADGKKESSWFSWGSDDKEEVMPQPSIDSTAAARKMMQEQRELEEMKAAQSAAPVVVPINNQSMIDSSVKTNNNVSILSSHKSYRTLGI